MREMRRRFLIGVAAGIFLTVGAPSSFAQRHVHRPIPEHQPGFPPSLRGDNTDAQLNPKDAKAAMLLQNEKEFREGVEQLSVLVNELKEEMEKTPSTDTLSVRMYKKAQEIEKLAKQIKNKSKG
jgi:hypothetical protein